MASVVHKGVDNLAEKFARKASIKCRKALPISPVT